MSETYSAEYPASKKPRLFACHVCGCGPAREDGGVELFRVGASDRKPSFYCAQHLPISAVEREQARALSPDTFAVFKRRLAEAGR